MDNALRVTLVLLTAIAATALLTSGPIAPLSGSVLGPGGEAAAGVVVALVPALGRHRRVLSDGTGRFAFTVISPGHYRLGAMSQGFFSPWEAVLMTGPPVQQDVKLEAAPVVMRTGITDRDPSGTVEIPGPEFTGPASVVRGFQRDRDTAVRQHRLVPPRLITMRRPEFPTALRGTGVEGSVSVEGRIGADGLAKAVRCETGVHTDLEQAAVAALREWRWEAAQVNGSPVEVPLNVTVDFIHQR